MDEGKTEPLAAWNQQFIRSLVEPLAAWNQDFTRSLVEPLAAWNQDFTRSLVEPLAAWNQDFTRSLVEPLAAWNQDFTRSLVKQLAAWNQDFTRSLVEPLVAWNQNFTRSLLEPLAAWDEQFQESIRLMTERISSTSILGATLSTSEMGEALRDFFSMYLGRDADQHDFSLIDLPEGPVPASLTADQKFMLLLVVTWLLVFVGALSRADALAFTGIVLSVWTLYNSRIES